MVDIREFRRDALDRVRREAPSQGADAIKRVPTKFKDGYLQECGSKLVQTMLDAEYILYGYMKVSALLPVKALEMAKSRLASAVPVERREALVLSMLRHVIYILQESDLVSRVFVVSSDARVLERAQAWGAQPLIEEQQGHNPALYAAARRIMKMGGRQAHQEDEALLTISADLPLLTTEDIQGLVEQAARHAVTLAGSEDGTGTNAILMRPPLVLPYLFGPHSLPAYMEEARKRQLSYTVYTSRGLAVDIDTPHDLRRLEAAHCECEAREQSIC